MKKAKVVLFLTVIFVCLGSQFGFGQSYRWKNVALGGGGFVSAVITTPAQKNLIYARTDVGGAYRWNEDDQSWIPLTDWVSDDEVGYLGVEAIAIDPQLPENVYMLAGISYFNGGKTAILRSNNYGETFSVTEVSNQFKAHGNGIGRANGERLIVDPNKSNILFCGTRRNGLFKSIDSGKTWQSVSSLPVSTTPNDNGIAFVVMDPSSAAAGNATQTIYVGVSRMGSDNLFVSHDGGLSWKPVPGHINNFMPQRYQLTSSGILYITYGNGAGPHGHWSAPEPMDNGAIYKYDIKNKQWSDISPMNGRPFSGISVDHNNSNKIIATTINTYLQQPWGWGDRIFVSEDAGATWKDLIGTNSVTMDVNGFPWIENHAIHWAGTIEIDPFNSDRVFVTSGNGIFMSDNLSASKSTWKFSVKGLEETVPLDAVSLANKSFFNVIGDYDGFITTNLDQSPVSTHNPGMGTTTGLSVAALQPNKMIRVGDEIYFSENSGESWQKLNKPNADVKGRIALSADGSVIIWCPEGSSISYRSDNGGASWTTSKGLDFNAAPFADAQNAKKFYAYNPDNGNFYLSVDAGVTFNLASNPGQYGGKNIRPVPGVEGDVWVALYNGGLTRTTNSGSAFDKITSIATCSAVGFGIAKQGNSYPIIYIWGSPTNLPVGIYRSDDVGKTWVRINDDLHEFGGPGNGQFVIGDATVYGRVYMSTAGRGIVYGEPEASVGNQPKVEAVAQSNASPSLLIHNDLNGSIEIHSQLTGYFELEVYSPLRGVIAKKVVYLREGSQNKYEVPGYKEMGAGLYILRLKSNQQMSFSKYVKF